MQISNPQRLHEISEALHQSQLAAEQDKANWVRKAEEKYAKAMQAAQDKYNTDMKKLAEDEATLAQQATDALVAEVDSRIAAKTKNARKKTNS